MIKAEAPSMILGAGRQALHVLDLMKWIGMPCDSVVLFDDVARQQQFGPYGLPIRGMIEDGVQECIRSGAPSIVAIGSRFGAFRYRIFRQLAAAGVPLVRLVHSSCVIAPDADIGPNLVMMPGCVIAPKAKIGPLCCMFSNCSIEHDCSVGTNTIFGAGVICCGAVKIGDHCFLGSGAICCPEVQIGDRSLIGAGSVVASDVPSDVVLAGHRAHLQRRPEKGGDVPLASELGEVGAL